MKNFIIALLMAVSFAGAANLNDFLLNSRVWTVQAPAYDTGTVVIRDLVVTGRSVLCIDVTGDTAAVFECGNTVYAVTLDGKYTVVFNDAVLNSLNGEFFLK